MKKILFLTIILLCISAAVFYFYALPKVQSQIETKLSAFGFKDLAIEGAKIHLDGISIKNITLDKDNFSNIQNLKTNIFWPEYLFTSKINSIEIENLNISLTTEELIANTSYIHRSLSKHLGTLDIDTFTIHNLVIDLSTQYGAIRTASTIKKQLIDGSFQYDIAAKAEQHQLSFTSEIAAVENDNKLNIEGKVDGLKINMPPLTINRASGWLSFDNATNNSFSAQLDAGSGRVLGIPLQSISILSSQQQDYFPVILRSNITGNKSAKLQADIHISNKIDNQHMNIEFKSADMKNLITYLTSNNILKQKSFNALPNEYQLSINYLKERRFDKGPWPFEIKATNLGNDSAKGVFLIYPDSLDIRGSAQGNKDILSFTNEMLSIKDINENPEMIRIDDNLKRYLTQ